MFGQLFINCSEQDKGVLVLMKQAYFQAPETLIQQVCDSSG